MAAEWGGNPIVPEGGGEPQLPSRWPARLGGYAKLIATAVTTLGATGVITWLQAAGVTSLSAPVTAGITAAVGLLTVLLSPRNKV